MNCRKAQEKVLETFDADLAPLEKQVLERHLSECASCAHFASRQSRLDLRLREQITPPPLGSAFRVAVRARVARQSRSVLPDWLPDIAYLGGSAAGLALCVVLLPFAAPTVMATGALAAGVVYLLQTLLLTTLQQSVG